MLRLLGLTILLVTGLAAAMVDRAPSVPPGAPPDSASAVRAHDVVRRLMALGRDPKPLQPFALDSAEMDAVLQLAPRFVPGLRATAVVDGAALTIKASQSLGHGLWLNVRTTVLPADTGLRLGGLQLGAIPLPSQALLDGAVAIADSILGAPSIGAVLAGLRDTRIGPDGVQTVLSLPLETRKAMSTRLQQAARRVAVRVDVGLIDAVLAQMHRAQRSGDLPQTDSALPYLRFVIEVAQRKVMEDGQNPQQAAGAALIALAIACGERHLQAVTGTEAGQPAWDQAWYCRRTTLGGRIDLRQHFTVSAGLKAASDIGAAAMIGELKELYDSRPRGSGFSFDDLAANRAGLAFAGLLLNSPAADWPRIVGLLTDEAAILPPFADLPSGLSRDRFEADFGDIDSPAFAAMLAEIDRRIAALAVHRALADRPG